MQIISIKVKLGRVDALSDHLRDLFLYFDSITRGVAVEGMYSIIDSVCLRIRIRNKNFLVNCAWVRGFNDVEWFVESDTRTFMVERSTGTPTVDRRKSETMPFVDGCGTLE